MNIRFSHFLLYFGIISLLSGVLISEGCSRSTEPDPIDIKDHKESSILLYAVASNNLASSLASDLQEIVNVAPELDLDKNDIYVYYLTQIQLPSLYRLEYDKKSGVYSFVKKKEYDRSQFSTDPKRISMVINDYVNQSDADTRGIIFWSHGTGWMPYFADHEVPVEDDFSTADNRLKSFGYDSYLGTVDQCDIIELAEAIPSDTFHYIWFDCCYMGGIEVAYQLRNKADYMVGYCTEVWGDGMQYSLTMPYLVGKTPDLPAAAKAFSDYYINQRLATTVGVYDLSQIEGVAEVTAERFDTRIPLILYMQNYGRSGYKFYDFGQYQKSKLAPIPEKWSHQAFDEAMSSFEDTKMNEALSKFVIFKQSADIDFNRMPLSLDDFSGVSVHNYTNSTDASDDYYRQTDWYKRISIYSAVGPDDFM